jgi:hypothetical protein
VSSLWANFVEVIVSEILTEKIVMQIDNDRNVLHFLLLSCYCHFDLFTLKNTDLGHNKG